MFVCCKTIVIKHFKLYYKYIYDIFVLGSPKHVNTILRSEWVVTTASVPTSSQRGTGVSTVGVESYFYRAVES